VFPGKRAQNQARLWAENGSGWERIVNADMAVGSTAAPKATSGVNAYSNENTEKKFSERLNPV
jgi:hypothetical protein